MLVKLTKSLSDFHMASCTILTRPFRQENGGVQSRAELRAAEQAVKNILNRKFRIIYADARKGGLTPELRPLSTIIFVTVLVLLIVINKRAEKSKS